MNTQRLILPRILGLIFLLGTFTLQANDECVNAIQLTPGLTCTPVEGSFSGSTMSDAAPSCAPSASQDVWYRFTATQSTMRVLLNATSGLNHGFEIRQGGCGGNVLACVNTYGSGISETYLDNNFSVGVEYYIRVFNANSQAVGLGFGICIQEFESVLNDLCQDAVNLNPGSACVPVSGSFNGAGVNTPPPACYANALQDVWYSFVANDSTMSISLEASAGLNHGFELIRSGCSGEVLACVNNGPSGNGEFLLRHDFVIGQSYLIRVFNAGSSISVNSFGICVRNYPAPVNDACQNATLLSSGNTCISSTSSLIGSGITGAIPSCASQASQDIWFKFVADARNMSINLASVAGLNHGLEVYQNNCSGNLIACVNNSSSGGNESYSANLFSPGETYFIRVFNVNPAYFFGDVSICVQRILIPDNDSCIAAIALTPSNTCIPVSARFNAAGIGPDLPSCGTSAGQDIWFQFTASQPQMSVTLSAVSGLNHGFEILEGSCSGSLLQCINSNASGVGETYFGNQFTPGQKYFIRVFNTSTGPSTLDFNICVQQFGSPANDLCTNAQTLVPKPNCTPTSGSFSGSSLTQPSPSCVTQASQDVWYRFTASDSTMSIQLNPGAGLNIGFELFESSCSGASLLCVNANTSGIVETYTGKIFKPGESYYLRAFNVNSVFSQASFNVCVFGVVQPCTSSIMITANDSSVCEGTPIQFTANAENEGAFPVYQWWLNGMETGSNEAQFILNQPVQGDWVICSLISSDPCAGQATVFSDTVYINVESKATPLFAAIEPVCKGNMFQLPTQSENGIAGAWEPEIDINQSRLYYFTPDSGQCARMDSMLVEVISVDTSLNVNNNFLSARAESASYQWLRCEEQFTLMDGETNQELEVVSTGSYAVIINQGNCSDTSRCVFVSTLGGITQTPESLTLSPNPVEDNCILTVPPSLIGAAYLVSDLNGRVVLSGSLSSPSTIVETKSLKPGMYFIRTDRHIAGKRIIKR